MKSLLIAIDYDDTFTADPDLWRGFIALARSRGHRVACITCREACEENAEEIREALPIDVLTLMTSGSAKRWYAEQMGVTVDIWCDDQPEHINGPR